MQKFAVIGYPLTHSLSPQIHNFAFKKLKIDAIYEKIEIAQENFSESVNQLKKAGYSGLNITIPHKLNIRSFIDEVDSDAKTIGAVNTIVIKESKWIGYNTDVHGFLAPIVHLKNIIRDCLVLGTGGAARAVIFTLAKYLEPRSITIVGRNRKKAVNLSEELGSLFKLIHFGTSTFREAESIISRINLIVNSTPLGTFPNTDQTPLPNLGDLSKQSIVYDLVYNPLKTKLLKDAAKVGKDIFLINGMEMFLQQAAGAFKLWTGQDMPVADVREYMLNLKNET
jgi:shikimate dehydrogenase